MLPPRFEEPAGFIWGDFTDKAGAHIRCGSLRPVNPQGTIVLVTGFGELIEKYFEVIRDMTERNYAVWIMDWRGQGGSDRYIKDSPQRMYSEGYDEPIVTLHQFATLVVQKSTGPLFLFGHSMGGHIGLRYLKEHAGVFDSAVFTSPMCDILTPGFARPVAQALVHLAKVLGFLKSYVPGGHDWKAGMDTFAGNAKTSDPVRFAVQPEIFRTKPQLRMGQPTYGWVLRAMESIILLNQADYLKSITTPVLIGIAGQDKIVDKAAEERACSLMPHCTRVDVAEAKHEIWMERDILRGPWLARVTEFLQARLHAAVKLG